MPGFDRTGPLGHGPRSGRRLGPCGRGMGIGKELGVRGGFGLRHTEPVELTKDEQKRILETELKELEAERQEIDRRLKELK